MIEKAYNKLKFAKTNLIVANNVSSKNKGFGSDTNEVFVIDKDRIITHLELASKQEISSKILDIIIKRL